MEKRCHSRMMLGQFWLSVRTSFDAVTKPPPRLTSAAPGTGEATRPAKPSQMFDTLLLGPMLGAEHQSGRSAAKRVFWSLTAVASLFAIVFIATR